MFRKLYWVTEQIGPNGNSSISGVFTSIPNLVKEGLACNKVRSMRLTLTKLDCEHGTLGTWTGPDFKGLHNLLDRFVESEEFSAEQCEALVSALASALTAA